MDAGARLLEEPRDTPYGDRRAMVQDAWGNELQIATLQGYRDRQAKKTFRVTIEIGGIA